MRNWSWLPSNMALHRVVYGLVCAVWCEAPEGNLCSEIRVLSGRNQRLAYFQSFTLQPQPQISGF